jgi:hypothetical protein
MVTGRVNHEQPFALVMLNADASLAATISKAERASLAAALTEHIHAVNSSLGEHEKLSLLAIVTKPWTPENSLLTPTLKIKRRQIEHTYGDHFDAWLNLLAQAQAQARPRGHLHAAAARSRALVEQRLQPVEVFDPGLGGVGGGQVHMQLHREVRRQHQPGMRRPAPRSSGKA